jgi:hypothetical protein
MSKYLSIISLHSPASGQHNSFVSRQPLPKQIGCKLPHLLHSEYLKSLKSYLLGLSTTLKSEIKPQLRQITLFF